MTTVLGPAALNEKKFTSWSERGRALGLKWDSAAGTVTIPVEKIAKSLCTVRSVLKTEIVTRTSVLILLRNLRHIATCCPPARAFFQRLQDVAIRFPRWRSHHLAPAALEDLRSFELILQRHDVFNQIPVSHFAAVDRPTVHVHMDASDEGLCALEPRLRQYIRVRFTDATKAIFRADPDANSINVRELQSAVLAALHWGPTWSQTSSQHPVHVCFWIDNASAVTWAQRRASRHPLAQLYNRLLSLAEVNYSLICTAAHVRGVDNVMADAGSRAWSAAHSLISTWTNLSSGWTQVPIDAPYDNLSAVGAMLRDHAVAASTSSKYHSHQKQWCCFSRYMNWSPWLDGTSRTACSKLGMFAIFCWRYGWNERQQGNQYGTIVLKLASIRWYHRRHRGVQLSTTADLDILLQGVRRLSDPVSKKQPVSPAFLRLLHRHLDLSQPRNLLLWGSVLLAYFFLLRRSEYLCVGGHRQAYCLKLTDAYFSDAHGVFTTYRAAVSVTICLAGSKNDQNGRGAWRIMHATREALPEKGAAVHHEGEEELGVPNECPPML